MRTAVNDAIAAITATILRESPFGDVAVAVVNVQEGTGPDDQPYVARHSADYDHLAEFPRQPPSVTSRMRLAPYRVSARAQRTLTSSDT